MATTQRRTKSSNTKRKTKKETMAEMERREQFRLEILLWIIIAISLLLFISNFGVGGSFGGACSGFIRGVFGTMGYVFPIILLVGSFFMISNRDNPHAWITFFGFFLLFTTLCLFFGLIAPGSSTLKPLEAYKQSKTNILGGGLFGGSIAYFLVPAFGKAGAFIIDIIVFIISVVMITGRSAMKGMQNQGRKVYESAKENNEKYQEYREYRAEERAKRRMDQKVSGVSADITVTKNENKGKKTDALSEIHPVDSILAESANMTPAVDSAEDAVAVEAQLKPERSIVPIGMREIAPEKTANTNFKDLTEPKAIARSVTPVISGSFKRDVTATFDDEKPMSEPVFEPDTEVNPVNEPENVEEQLSAQTDNAIKRKPKASEEEIAKGISEVAQEINQQAPVKQYVFPPKELLKAPDKKKSANTESQLMETADKLQKTLETFGVHVTVTNISCGPAVTRYEIQPEMGVKVSKIVGLADDIKLNLAAADIRIEAPIPGKAAVGIEVPNPENVMVSFRELIESKEFEDSKSAISFAVGRDIGGKVKVADIGKMPHVLIAGATGSGKSVCINTIIMSILYKANPEDVKLIMIDPKVVELSVYNGIPHLMIPVVTDPKKAAGALNWAVQEMTDRYQKFADCGVRDIKGYNERVQSVEVVEGQDRPQKMPQIVIIVDELADLMMVASGDVEEAICRLAQLARAAGIHLIIATQRPSVNVITGLIKANMPSRIAFAVTSGVDSRTILDMVGAEKLLGKGDMLFFPQGIPKPLRVQGAFVSDGEVAKVVDFLKAQNGNASYSDEMQKKIDSMEASSNQTVTIGNTDTGSDGRDHYFMEAAKIIIDKDKASIGMLQRFLKIGFNRAARIMDQLEEAGVVGPEEGTKPRKVLMSPEEFEQFVDET